MKILPIVMVLTSVVAIGYYTIPAITGGSSSESGFSNGMRTGWVVKLSKKGKLFKGWEGQLLLGTELKGAAQGEAGGQRLTSHLWAFSATETNIDRTVIDQLKSALISGRRVVLEYKQSHIKALSADTSYTITRVVIPK